MKIQDGFSPDDYKFTHLHTDQSEIFLESENKELAKALYLLKYALNTTLEQMISRSSQRCIYIDEMAMSSMRK